MTEFAKGGYVPGPPIAWISDQGCEYLIPQELAINMGMKYLEELSKLNVVLEEEDVD